MRDVRDTPGGDVVDAGVFQRSDLRSELRKMNRGEVEGRLGLSTHKVDAILNRAEVRTNQMYRNLVRKKGDIHYNAFLGKYINRLERIFPLCNLILSFHNEVTANLGSFSVFTFSLRMFRTDVFLKFEN